MGIINNISNFERSTIPLVVPSNDGFDVLGLVHRISDCNWQGVETFSSGSEKWLAEERLTSIMWNLVVLIHITSSSDR
jgi:hypothetical protein